MSSATAERRATATDRKPSGRQMFAILYRMLELSGREAPTNPVEASELISALDAALEAKRLAASGGDIPL